MKIKLLLTCVLLAFTQLAHAELAECKRVGYFNCTVDSDCHALVYARGGMCIKLGNIVKGKKYSCEKSGVVAIDKVDYESAKAVGLAVQQTSWQKLELDASNITSETAVVMFGIYDPYDTPERFTVSCKTVN